MIIQVPRGGALHRQLTERPPTSAQSGEVVIEAGPTDDGGNLEEPEAGEVVLSVPAPESLSREGEEVRRVLGQAGTGVAPLVVVVGAAEELSDEDLASVLDAAGRTSRAVILRVIRDA